MCYSTRNTELRTEFTLFWDAYTTDIPEAGGYNSNTLQGVYNLLICNPEELWEEDENVRQRVDQNVDRIVGSVRYTEKPGIRIEHLRNIVKALIFALITTFKGDEVLGQHIEQQFYLATIPQEELELKFNRFWNWYQTITLAVSYEDEAKKHFGMLLYIGEDIAGAGYDVVRRITRMVRSIRHRRVDFNMDEMIMQIIDRFVYSHIFELDEEETEVNKQRVLTRSSDEGTTDESNGNNSNEVSNESNSNESEEEIIAISPNNSDDQINIEYEDQDEEILINTGQISSSSEKSDSEESVESNKTNNSTSSDESLHLQQLFAMAVTQNQILRALENALGYPANTLNNALGAGQSIAERIENVNDRINIVETEVSSTVPTYHGKEEEDVEEWIAQIEALFTASGRNAGGNNANIARFAVGGLKGNALRWYTEQKNANNGNLVNWTDADNDNDLKHRIKRKFITTEIRRRKQRELQHMKQKDNESVESYSIRYKQIARIANRGANIPEEFKVNYFVNGLKKELRKQVSLHEPATLNDAINRARIVERVESEQIQQEVEDKMYEKGMEEILKNYNQQNKDDQNKIYQDMQKPKGVPDMDDLVKTLEKELEIKLLRKM